MLSPKVAGGPLSRNPPWSPPKGVYTVYLAGGVGCRARLPFGSGTASGGGSPGGPEGRRTFFVFLSEKEIPINISFFLGLFNTSFN